MNIRERKEKYELKYLSQFAFKSKNSLGREKYEGKCSIRTCFQRDRDRIIHSKSFRRLKDKTQVFISPKGDHYRTRLTHTFEVSQIARSISSALFLNEELTEAISLGHDLGHTPFGHIGEDALNKILENEGGFRHNEQSVRQVQVIEKNGKGLNLTNEVIDGIKNHRSGCKPTTLEAKVVQISDKIAYVNHDIEDAIRANILDPKSLPEKEIKLLGNTTAERINFLIRDIVTNSYDKNKISMTEEVEKALINLRKFMFKNVYESEILKYQRDECVEILNKIYDYYYMNFEEISLEFRNIFKYKNDSNSRIICDYIAGMTDSYALETFEKLYKKDFKDLKYIKNLY